MRAMKPLLLALFFLPFVASADPLNGSLDLGTSLSQSYEARNVFLHPAALGFDTALNGVELSTSLAIGTNKTAQQDYAFAAALGYLGFGAERLSGSTLSRYHFALGTPVYGNLFFGTRLTLNRYDNFAATEAWDVGLQYRPAQWFSLGLLFTQTNQPLLNAVRPPIGTVLSASWRPSRAFELTVDASTPSNDFLNTVSTQTMLNLSPLEGLKFRIGYHTDYRWMVGFQFHLGNLSLFSSLQPGVADRNMVFGFQSGITPYASAIAPPRITKVAIGASLSDEKVEGGLLTVERPSLLDLLKDFSEIEKDVNVTEVLIRLDEFPLGLASAQEVHAALWRLRHCGKQVTVFLGNAGLREYLIASAADRILLEPSGEIRWLGLKAEHYFAKGTLDKIGVEGEFLAAGKYKSAPEFFLRKESSEASRESVREELKSLESTLLALLQKTRRIDAAQWKRGLELGLLSADEALKERFIDAIGSFTTEVHRREKAGLVLPVTRRRKDLLAMPARIAVVVASGNILPSKMRLLSLGGTGQVTPSQMQRKLRKAQSDPHTRAILLRVSSPGGEVLASQQIATQLENLKEGLPLYVSMGDVAASGGYYIAAPGGRVFAGPMTITGSIGVFLGKFQFTGLYRFIDLHKEITSTSPYPGLYSEDRPWSKAERAVMARRLDGYYESFLQFVSKNRKLSPTDTAAAAQGRVWTGAQAQSRHLVDTLGGYFEALEFAAGELGLNSGQYEAVEIEVSDGIFDQLAQGPWSKASLLSQGPLSALLPPQLVSELLMVQSLGDSPFLYMAPYRVLK